MTEEERAAAYAICKERGHSPANIVLTSNPPWNVCKHCGSWYRWSEPELIEGNVPEASGSAETES